MTFFAPYSVRADAPPKFQVYPEEIAHTLRDNFLHNIEAGDDCMTRLMLPHLEHEAIVRLHAAGVGPAVESRKHLWPTDDHVRGLWVSAARQFPYGQDAAGRDRVTWCAAKVLSTAASLRRELGEGGNRQMVAALSMILICEAIEGGFTAEFVEASEERERAVKALAPFKRNSGRGEGPVKKLIREVLPKLERHLRRRPKAREVWDACSLKRTKGMKFVCSVPWGTPLEVRIDGDAPASYERFAVAVSEVRRKPKP